MKFLKDCQMNTGVKEVLMCTKHIEVLYVEDDDILQKTTKRIFDRLFKKVDIASNGVEGLEKYQTYLEQECCYDLVITDINMPRMDGIELIEKILEHNSEQKVMIISAHNEVDFFQRSIELNVSGYLTKPIDITQLYHNIVSICSKIYKKKKYQEYIEDIKLQNSILRQYNENMKPSEVQEEFLRNISHEIRTPLNLLMGSLSLFESKIDASDETSRQLIEILKSGSKNIETLVGRILQLSQLRSGIYRLQSNEYLLEPLLEETFDKYQELAQKAKITLRYTIDPSLHTLIMCDLNVIESIIGELLDNAIKFNAPYGEVNLLLMFNHLSKVLKIEVQDSGMGIDTEEQGKIFDLFYQVDGSLSRVAEGSGIGLTLVQYLAELTGGNIMVESANDKGSTFHVNIPTG